MIIPLPTHRSMRYSGYYSSSTIIGTINTYRPLELQSASASATYYTSGIDSVGLSNVTALTRESTSGESYLTETVSGQTGYHIISVVQATHTNTTWAVLTNDMSCTGTRLTYLKTSSIVTNLAFGVYDVARKTMTLSSSGTTAWYNSGTTGTPTRESITVATRTYNNRVVSWNSTFDNAASSAFNSLSSWFSSVGAQQIATDNPATVSVSMINSSKTYLSITASQFGDRTVTTGTSYLTCESTYGYSGVSSSSSESSSWG